MKIDKETGFPPVPEGFYWEVTKGTYYGQGDHLKVSLVNERGWVEDWALVHSIFGNPLDREEVRPRHLRRTALRVLESQDREKRVTDYIGTYPPKRLEKK